jgi:hypothetical protein
MDQSRRGFLKMLSLAIPVAAAAPSYFFAPGGGWYTGGLFYGFAQGGIVASPSVALPRLGECQFGQGLVFESSRKFESGEICRIFKVSPRFVPGPLWPLSTSRCTAKTSRAF